MKASLSRALAMRAYLDKIKPSVRVAASGCHEFIGGCDKDGYGHVRVRLHSGSDTYSAHRVVADAMLPDAGGPLVIHSCDNPPCVNPDHLRRGTVTDNNRDTVARGRWRFGRLFTPKGEDSPHAKLTDLQIAELARTPGRYRDIADRFHVSYSLVEKIKRGVYVRVRDAAHHHTGDVTDMISPRPEGAEGEV